MKSFWKFATVLCVVGMALSPVTSIATEIPPISSQEHCTLEVSKMLDKGEQTVEYEKCMLQEGKFEPGVRKLWTLLPEKQQKRCITFMFPPGKSYTNLAHCMSSYVGMSCMNGNLSCNPN